MIVVKEEQPFALAVKSEFLDSTCSFCLAHKALVFKCVGCHVLSYCNKDCQKSDWANHKGECSILCKYKEEYNLSAEMRLVLRILLKSEKRLAEKSFNGRTWDSLEDHNFIDRHWIEIFKDHSFDIRKMLGSAKDVKLQEIFQTFVKVKTNRLDISECASYSVILASGIYLGLSVHAESCLPTSQVIFDGRKATLRPFKKNAGYSPDLTFSRTLRSPFSVNRHSKFLGEYLYACQCPLCTDREHMMNKIGDSCYVECCKNGAGIWDIASRTHKCNKCGATSKIIYEDMMKVKPTLYILTKQVHWADEFIEKLKKCEKILSPLNYDLVDAIYEIFTRALLAGNRQKIVKYLEPRLTAALEYYFPESHFNRTSLSMTRSYFTFQGNDNFDVNKGYKAVLLTFGADHPVTKRFKADMEKYQCMQMMKNLAFRG